MRKLQIVLLALVATSAVGANSAGPASAETTLAALWLLEGRSIEGTEKVAAEVRVGGVLEDTKTLAGAAAILCDAIFDGTMLSAGEGEINEILNVNHEKIADLGGLALICESEKVCSGSGDTEVWPTGLPWLGRLYLTENGEFLARVVPMTGTAVGYELLCLVVGLNVEDECSVASFAILIVNNALTGMAEVPGGSELRPNWRCAQSSEETGVVETDEEAVFESPSGLWTVSSE